jgi:hypothetical protein
VTYPADLPHDPDTDPTRVVNQPSLTTSSGAIWLIVGGLFTAIALAVLIAMAIGDFQPTALPLVAAILVAALYLGMVIAGLTMPPGRVRLAVMAICLLASALIALATVLVVAFSV